MYGLPKEIDLSFLVGRELLQVCFGRHDLNLNFDRNVHISVTSCIGYSGVQGDLCRQEDFAAASQFLTSLLSQTVLSVKGDDEGTLVLIFSGGPELFVYDNSKQYESYTIQHGEQIVVV
jgi:hypothetical protein